MFDKLNNLMTQHSYCNDIEEIKSTTITVLKNLPSTSFSIFHLNICSIQLHIDELGISLEMLEFKFSISAVPEKQINKATFS